jgi:hypothetical protein
MMRSSLRSRHTPLPLATVLARPDYRILHRAVDGETVKFAISSIVPVMQTMEKYGIWRAYYALLLPDIHLNYVSVWKSQNQ